MATLTLDSVRESNRFAEYRFLSPVGQYHGIERILLHRDGDVHDAGGKEKGPGKRRVAHGQIDSIPLKFVIIVCNAPSSAKGERIRIS